ncbi:membrane protein insertion efficiency factor YidD [Candidatus Saccharibacteria bacterium]|nr:membrane protein insertion efficiency factor YidD [Candidatus Saccharibacteria bacterium]
MYNKDCRYETSNTNYPTKCIKESGVWRGVWNFNS